MIIGFGALIALIVVGVEDYWRRVGMSSNVKL